MVDSTALLLENGKGKTLVLVYEQHRRFTLIARKLVDRLCLTHRVLLIQVAPFTENNWHARFKELEQIISQSGIRYACFISFGSVGALVQRLYLSNSRLVRSLVLIDATTSPHPSLWTRIIDKLENILPVGLPLRSFGKGFNGKSFLQRIRCPCLIVFTSSASSYQKSEASYLLRTLPTSWKAQIPWGKSTEALVELISSFQNVAAKCPQKNKDLQKKNEIS